MVNINKKILKLCEERSWTTYMLAQKADITHSTLNSFINRDTPPKIDTLERICGAFGITLAQFFMEDEYIEILSNSEKEIVSLFRRLPHEKQSALITLLLE
ncbi:MAG: helix-turn-helix transcriptional regulator [Clostridia bacterium]|nr:helix-turn-helix transcriptional regulator [Clostridia bacterium]